MEKFTFFWKGPFSQWAQSYFEVDGVHYNCCEQFMMAQKAIMFEGPAWSIIGPSGNRELTTLGRIMTIMLPSEQKKLGRLVKNFDVTRWNEVAKSIVYKGNYAKFSQNPNFKKAIFETTGTTLVEASPLDKIWGIGLSEEDERAKDRSHWLGTNWLGEVLTQVRDDLMVEDGKK